MKIRADLAELLRAGGSDRAIAQRLHLDAKTVAAARERLGLPKTRPGRKAASTPEDLFRQRVRPTEDGHMEWTGYTGATGTIGLRHGGTFYTAYRIAFRIANGRDPEGYALPNCGRDQCVKPGHHSDRVGRAQERRLNALYGQIFGRQE